MLKVEDLHTVYFQGNTNLDAVRGVSIEVESGSSTALVGESGSGKSTAALSIMRLIRPPIGDIAGGRAYLDDRDLFSLSNSEMRHVLLNDIGYVPQDPTTALDPLFTVRTQISEAMSKGDRSRNGGGRGRSGRDQEIVALLDRLGVVRAEERLKSYPHEFSGGMRQRVAIAVALAKSPSLLIADEPTTAVDVTTQLGILNLLDELRRERNLAMLLVTHDLAVAKLICQRVAVMYGGLIVEAGPIHTVLAAPQHPYTRALLDADPSNTTPRTRLRAIEGQPPALSAMPPGCPFAPRCPLAVEECITAVPVVEQKGQVSVRCIRAGEVAA